jgi:hypothetical protein
MSVLFRDFISIGFTNSWHVVCCQTFFNLSFKFMEPFKSLIFILLIVHWQSCVIVFVGWQNRQQWNWIEGVRYTSSKRHVFVLLKYIKNRLYFVKCTVRLWGSGCYLCSSTVLVGLYNYEHRVSAFLSVFKFEAIVRLLFVSCSQLRGCDCAEQFRVMGHERLHDALWFHLGLHDR